MKLLESIMTAFSVLRASKIRAFLTMLGIIIGIGDVIRMMSFGAGAKKLLFWEVEKVGGPSVFGVYCNDWIRKSGTGVRNPTDHFLAMDDVRAIQTECPSVDVATPEWEHVGPYLLAQRTNTLVCKLLPYEYQVARKWHNGYGRFLSDDDLDLWSKVMCNR